MLVSERCVGLACSKGHIAGRFQAPLRIWMMAEPLLGHSFSSMEVSWVWRMRRTLFSSFIPSPPFFYPHPGQSYFIVQPSLEFKILLPQPPELGLWVQLFLPPSLCVGFWWAVRVDCVWILEPESFNEWISRVGKWERWREKREIGPCRVKWFLLGTRTRA